MHSRCRQTGSWLAEALHLSLILTHGYLLGFAILRGLGSMLIGNDS